MSKKKKNNGTTQTVTIEDVQRIERMVKDLEKPVIQSRINIELLLELIRKETMFMRREMYSLLNLYDKEFVVVFDITTSKNTTPLEINVYTSRLLALSKKVSDEFVQKHIEYLKNVNNELLNVRKKNGVNKVTCNKIINILEEKINGNINESLK